MAEQNLPKVGSVVVCRVFQILNYGVFVELPDYNNLRGFVHISQVASSWIKNIRNFVKEGQLRAAYVSAMNEEKGQIDLSFTKVSSGEERFVLDEWRSEKRNKKLLEMLAAQNKKTVEIVLKEVAEPLTKEYGSLYAAFQTIALSGEKAVVGVSPSWIHSLVELVKKNVDIPKKSIKGVFSINVLKPNGVEIIKDAFEKNPCTVKDTETEIFYSGGGKYSLKVTSYNFKISERGIGELTEKIEKAIKSADSKAAVEFTRLEN